MIVWPTGVYWYKRGKPDYREIHGVRDEFAYLLQRDRRNPIIASSAYCCKCDGRRLDEPSEFIEARHPRTNPEYPRTCWWCNLCAKEAEQAIEEAFFQIQDMQRSTEWLIDSRVLRVLQAVGDVSLSLKLLLETTRTPISRMARRLKRRLERTWIARWIG